MSDEREAYVKAVIQPFCMGDERLMELMMVSVGRVLGNANLRTGQDVLGETDSDDIRHVRDWLKAALVNGVHWLEKTDGLGRPRKLMKFSTLEDIIREADKDMLRMSDRIGRNPDGPGDIEAHTELANGFRMVRLLTSTALDRESAEMQHCIGHGAYDDLLKSGTEIFLSLRDRFGNPHATVHIAEGAVEQISGKQNRMPVAKYLPYLAAFFRANPAFRLDHASGVDGYVVDREGAFHSVSSLPSDLRVQGDLYLRDERDDDTAFEIPSTIEATGSIDLDTARFRGELTRLVCEGTLRFLGDGATLPDDTVAAGLVISHTSVSELPSTLEHLSEFSLWNTPNIKTLPPRLRCSGDVSLGRTGFDHIPRQMLNDGGRATHGSLSIQDGQITSLDTIRRVDGSLALRNSAVAEIPDGLTVNNFLTVWSGAFRRMGRDVQVGHDCVIQDANFELSEGIKVGRALQIERCTVRLPSRIEIKGALQLQHCDVERMPDEISCGGSVIIRDTTYDRFPSKIRATNLFLRQLKLDRLEGDIEVEELGVFGDKPLTFGKGVRAEIVHIYDTRQLGVFTLPFAKARQYLRNPSEYGSVESLCETGSRQRSMLSAGRLRQVPLKGARLDDFHLARSTWLMGKPTSYTGSPQ